MIKHNRDNMSGSFITLMARKKIQRLPPGSVLFPNRRGTIEVVGEQF